MSVYFFEFDIRKSLKSRLICCIFFCFFIMPTEAVSAECGTLVLLSDVMSICKKLNTLNESYYIKQYSSVYSIMPDEELPPLTEEHDRVLNEGISLLTELANSIPSDFPHKRLTGKNSHIYEKEIVKEIKIQEIINGTDYASIYSLAITYITTKKGITTKDKIHVLLNATKCYAELSRLSPLSTSGRFEHFQGFLLERILDLIRHHATRIEHDDSMALLTEMKDKNYLVNSTFFLNKELVRMNFVVQKMQFLTSRLIAPYRDGAPSGCLANTSMDHGRSSFIYTRLTLAYNLTSQSIKKYSLCIKHILQCELILPEHEFCYFIKLRARRLNCRIETNKKLRSLIVNELEDAMNMF